MYKRIVVLTLSVVALAGHELEAQRLPITPRATVPLAVAERASAARFRDTDYRWEGAIFGSAVSGVTVAILRAGACRSAGGEAGSNCASQTLTGGLIGAVGGAMVGYLVGSLIAKQ